MKKEISKKLVRPKFELKGEIINSEHDQHIIIDGENATPWPDAQFGVPNKFLRSAVFGVQREKREGVLDQFTFSYRNNYDITFTGPLLNQDDSIVWQAILRAVKNTDSPLGAAIAIRKIDVLHHLNKTNGGDNYKWLTSSLDKLSTSHLKCVKGNEVFTSNLILGYSSKESSTYFSAGISSFLAPLLSEDLTDIDLLRKSKLKSQLSRWLHDFYSSHSLPIPYSVEKLHSLCRSKQAIAKFKMALKKSIEELKNCEPPLFSEKSFLDVKENILYVEKESFSPYVPALKVENEKVDSKVKTTSSGFLVL